MAVNKEETVNIVRDLVTLLVTELTGSGAWVDNLDGTFTLPLCRTYWLKAQDVITVDSIDYTITNVTKDTSVTVTAASVPTALNFYLDAPSFYHGTIIQTNQELSQDVKNVEERSPMAYLLRDLEETFFDNSNLLDRETNIRLFFLHDTNFQDYTTELADEETLEPMRTMAYFFVEEVLKKSKLIGKIEDYTIRDYLRFGRENASGYTENIFNDNFSGVELSITLPIKHTYLCECDDVRAKIKYIDSDSILKSVNFGETPVCTPNGGGDINVSNSNDTYSVDTSVDLELPDITHTDSDGSPVILPAQTPFVATTCPNSDIAKPIQTGQTTSYQSNDDGDLENGRLVNFFTLNSNNSFGNTNRFTDTLGTQIYANDIVIDHATNFKWYRIDLATELGTGQDFSDCIINAATVTVDSGGWRAPNINELLSIANFEEDTRFSYSPMNFTITGSGARLWTSTTNSATGAGLYFTEAGRFQAQSKTNQQTTLILKNV
jgi:hypothetical protein